jgi:acetyltransferase-like isoleucine patch superfamily enzyme
MAAEDPLTLFSRAATKLHTAWPRSTYPFAGFGRGVSIHYSCDIGRGGSERIVIGDEVFLAADVWLNAALGSAEIGPQIVLGKGCKIGRRSIISARNRIVLESNVLLAPAVLIMDHNHEYSDPNLPIHAQGITSGGTITIERNCWIGYNAVIFCGTGELKLGHNSVVGANAVVTASFPAHSVVAGNPARLVKAYDEVLGKWHRVAPLGACGTGTKEELGCK